MRISDPNDRNKNFKEERKRDIIKNISKKTFLYSYLIHTFSGSLVLESGLEWNKSYISVYYAPKKILALFCHS